MKTYNTAIPQDSHGLIDHEELENMFEENPSAYNNVGNKLSMRKHIGPTKGRLRNMWDDRRYYGRPHGTWKMINNKLTSYVGWNVDRARSDFYKWWDNNRVPENDSPKWHFDYQFGLSGVYSSCGSKYYIDDQKIIRKAPPTEYDLRRTHSRYYTNMGHVLLGYQLNPNLTRHQEMIDAVTKVYGLSITNYLHGELIDAKAMEYFSQNTGTNVIYNKFHELYGVDITYQSGKRKKIYGKYWKPEYGSYYGLRLDKIFVEIYSPDNWVKKSPDEIRKHRIRCRMAAKESKQAIKKNKKAKNEYYKKVYEDGIARAKGAEILPIFDKI